jgi:hypothetical protein
MKLRVWNVCYGARRRLEQAGQVYAGQSRYLVERRVCHGVEGAVDGGRSSGASGEEHWGSRTGPQQFLGGGDDLGELMDSRAEFLLQIADAGGL